MKKIVLLVILLFSVVLLSSCNAIKGTVQNALTGDYAVGTIDGNNFASEWLGIRFTAPSGFIMSTQEEMREFSLIGMEEMGVNSATINWADMTVAFEMMAMTEDAMSSVSVLTERILSRNMTVEEYLDISIQVFAEATGWAVNLNSEIGTIDFAGQEWHTATANVQAFGLEWTYRYLAHKFDNRMAFITIYAPVGQEDDIELLIKSFKAY